MKKIECIVRPTALPDLEKKLNEVTSGMTVTHVKGCGAQRGEVQIYRGAEMTVNLLAKIKIETVVCDDKVEKVIEIVKEVCQTGSVGDGKIFISPVEDVIRIRTGESGEKAL